MSFPREMTLRQYKNRLYVNAKPVYTNGLDKISTDKVYNYNAGSGAKTIDNINDEIKAFLGNNEDLLRVEATFTKTRHGTTNGFGVKVKTDYKTFTKVGFEYERIICMFRPVTSALTSLKSFESAIDLTEPGVYTLEVLVDRASVEAYY